MNSRDSLSKRLLNKWCQCGFQPYHVFQLVPKAVNNYSPVLFLEVSDKHLSVMRPLHCYICVLNWKTREMAFACEDSDLSSSKVPLKQKTVPKRLPYLEAYYPLHHCWQSQDGQTPSEQTQIPWSPNQGVNVNSSQMSALKVLCPSPQLLPLHMLKSREKTRNWRIVFTFKECIGSKI